MLTFKAILPAPSASDVVSQTLLIKITEPNGQPVVSQIANATNETTFDAPDNAEVRLSVIQIDDAGNPSEPSDEFIFTATDTLPPPKPGVPGAVLISEA